MPGPPYRLVAEVVAVSEAGRLAALERAGLVHPRAEAVTAPLFSSGGFFLPADKVQVKYEMLRAHLAEQVPVTAAAAAHGYPRAASRLGGGAGRTGGRPVRGGAAPAHQRAGTRPVSTRMFWPPAEAAQADYEMLRAHLLQ